MTRAILDRVLGRVLLAESKRMTSAYIFAKGQQKYYRVYTIEARENMTEYGFLQIFDGLGEGIRNKDNLAETPT